MSYWKNLNWYYNFSLSISNGFCWHFIVSKTLGELSSHKCTQKCRTFLFSEAPYFNGDSVVRCTLSLYSVEDKYQTHIEQRCCRKQQNRGRANSLVAQWHHTQHINLRTTESKWNSMDKTPEVYPLFLGILFRVLQNTWLKHLLKVVFDIGFAHFTLQTRVDCLFLSA